MENVAGRTNLRVMALWMHKPTETQRTVHSYGTRQCTVGLIDNCSEWESREINERDGVVMVLLTEQGS
jgi:hypothetical protein